MYGATQTISTISVFQQAILKAPREDGGGGGGGGGGAIVHYCVDNIENV